MEKILFASNITDLGLHITNVFFFAFHTVLIFFNLFGWFYRPMQKLNLISLLVTFGSWFLLGLWKGWGYCFLTDWHYQVLRALGERDMPSSYIAFLIGKISDWSPNSQLVDILTVGLALVALLCSLWVNSRNWKREKRS